MENKGFTLIELLIVIAIIGILVGIALPSYQSHVQKSKRIEVQMEMSAISVLAERQFARLNTYPSSATRTINNYSLAYTNLVDNSPPEVGFIITATPQGGQADEECGTMTMNQIGDTTAMKSNVDVTIKCW